MTSGEPCQMDQRTWARLTADRQVDNPSRIHWKIGVHAPAEPAEGAAERQTGSIARSCRLRSPAARFACISGG